MRSWKKNPNPNDFFFSSKRLIFFRSQSNLLKFSLLFSVYNQLKLNYLIRSIENLKAFNQSCFVRLSKIFDRIIVECSREIFFKVYVIRLTLSRLFNLKFLELQSDQSLSINGVHRNWFVAFDCIRLTVLALIQKFGMKKS